MKRLLETIAAAVLLLPAGVSAQTAPGFGSEEFGLTQRQLVQAVEQVEELIAKCMRAQGFQYIAADYDTVRAGMKSDKAMPGLSRKSASKARSSPLVIRSPATLRGDAQYYQRAKQDRLRATESTYSDCG